MASHKAQLTRRIIYILLFIAVVYGGVIGFNRYVGAMMQKGMASAPAPVVNVTTARAKTVTWREQLQAVASIKAVQGTTLTTQSAGTVTAIHFHSGDTVKAGDLLVQLNDNVAQARLAADRARLLKAKQELERQRRLSKKSLSTEADLQAAQAAYNESAAAIEADKATLVNLQVRAPFDGHLGIRQVSLGQFVSPGTGVVEIQQWDPLLVDFNIPQRDLSRISVGDPISLSINGIPGRTFEGTISALGASVDNATRNLGVRATLPNADGVLRPGMFGDVTIRLEASNKVVAVPNTAITYNTYGEYVYLVADGDKGKVAKQRIVKTGTRRNELVAVTHGLKSGDEVVTEGQVNLHPGAKINIQSDSTAQQKAVAAKPQGVD